jgi:hypothetical protein
MNSLTIICNIFLLILSQLSASEIPFQVCSKARNTRYHVDQIDVETTSDGLEFFIYGLPDSDIVCGHLDVTVRVLNQKIFSKEFDLCDYTTCPLLANQPSVITGSVNQSLPSGSYSIVVRMDRDCNNCQTQCGLGCVQFDYST